MNNPYDFPSIVAVKIIVRNGNRFLLLREPKTNEWMPGRLGLPGGKLLLHESIDEVLKRKIQTEIGFEISIMGLIKIIDILMPNRNVYHFIFLADYVSGEIDTTKTEANEMKWYSESDLEALSKDDYTEYYNDVILKEVMNGSYQVIPIEVIQTQDNGIPEIMSWMANGNKKETTRQDS